MFDECGQTIDVRRRDVCVSADAEEQGDVDVDALADQLANRRHAFGRARHFDHQVVAADSLPQAARILDRGGRVVREIGRHFQADVAVRALGGIVDGTKEVGCVADVANRQRLVQRHRFEVTAPFDFLQGVKVIGAAGDRLFEDRRIGGDAAQPVLRDQAAELTAREQAAPQIIQPDRLTKPLQVL